LYSITIMFVTEEVKLTKDDATNDGEEKTTQPSYPVLTDDDLQNNRFAYDIDTIVWNIQHGAINLRTLVRTQKLTPYVCAKYVVFGGHNEMYAFGTEDAWISSGDVLNHQPHITSCELSDAHKLADIEDAEEDLLDCVKRTTYIGK